MSSSSSKGTHSLRFYTFNTRLSLSQPSIRHNNFLGVVVPVSSLFRTGKREAGLTLFAEASANQLGSFGPWAGWGLLVFCCIFGRVCHLSCRRSGDPSGRGHVVVPRGRARSVLPARASLAHSDPLVSSSIAFCWALHRVRCSWTF